MKIKKNIKLLTVLIAILVLTGCNNSISPPGLSTEQGIKEYLVDEWTCNMEYMSNIVVNMTIHENLDIELSFYDSLTNESKGDYKGNIIELITADYTKSLEEISEESIDKIKDQIFNITESIYEIQEHLDTGMSILFTGETTIIDGEKYYEIALGTNHEEIFVREIYYAVNITTGQVYKYDILNDLWEEI